MRVHSINDIKVIILTTGQCIPSVFSIQILKTPESIPSVFSIHNVTNTRVHYISGIQFTMSTTQQCITSVVLSTARLSGDEIQLVRLRRANVKRHTQSSYTSA